MKFFWGGVALGVALSFLYLYTETEPDYWDEVRLKVLKEELEGKMYTLEEILDEIQYGEVF